MDIISGEQIQLLASTILGYSYDFSQNPFIIDNAYLTFVDFRCVIEYDNPPIMFCYGHRIDELSLHIYKFINPFVLISHNSDYNIIDCVATQEILNCENLIMWFGQNVEYVHHKMHFLPIGIANRMFPHGNLSFFKDLKGIEKDKNVYMSFKESTNFDARSYCIKSLTPIIEFLPIIGPRENICLLRRYKFCICPEGNGLDTHRLWESLYVKTVPILLRSKFSENIQNTTNLPMILLDSWEDLELNSLPDYTSFDFDIGSRYLSLHYYKTLIYNHVSSNEDKSSLVVLKLP